MADLRSGDSLCWSLPIFLYHCLVNSVNLYQQISIICWSYKENCYLSICLLQQLFHYLSLCWSVPFARETYCDQLWSRASLLPWIWHSLSSLMIDQPAASDAKCFLITESVELPSWQCEIRNFEQLGFGFSMTLQLLYNHHVPFLTIQIYWNLCIIVSICIQIDR